MQFRIIDAKCEIGYLGSILFRFFAIFLYQYSLPPCYNPIENHSKPQRRFPVEKNGNRVERAL